MTPETAAAVLGMQDAIAQAGSAALLVWAGVVLWIGFVLLLDHWGWLP